SSKVACEWYLLEEANPIFLAEGCLPELYRSTDEPRDVDVCFVGQAYGFRREFIMRLRRMGLDVTVAGRGWPSGELSASEMIGMMTRAKVLLGVGGIGWSESIKNLKGRDFDAPCAGPYVTAFNPDLADFFEIGREVLCYSSPDEVVEEVRRILRDEAA